MTARAARPRRESKLATTALIADRRSADKHALPDARRIRPLDPPVTGFGYCPRCRHEMSSLAASYDVFDDRDCAIVVSDGRRRVPPYVWQILGVLRGHQGAFVNAESFYKLIWEPAAADPPFVEQVLRVHIWRLRKLLAGTGWRIDTRWGFGYRLEREDRPCA